MEVFFIVIISLIMGSFASCVSYRLAQGQGFVFTRSKCVKCNATLKAKNLIPLFSWIFQKGKCHSCGDKISLRYPFIELFFLVSFLAIYFLIGRVDQSFILLCLIVTLLIIMSIIDIDKYFIPDLLQIILMILAIFWAFLNGGSNMSDNILEGIVFAAFGGALYALFYITTKQEAIGIDDIKLLFIIGFMIGLTKFLAFIFFAGIFGVVFGVLWKKIKKEDAFPFAPALCLSLFICLMLDKKFNISDVIGSILFLQSF